MLPADIETAPALAHLSLDGAAVDADRSTGLSRRAFLQGALAAGAVGVALPSWVVEAAGAAPLAPTEGVLVVVLMGGGNDGLNMVVPFQDGAYYDRRGGLAIPLANVRPLAGSDVGLHPALGGLAQRYAAGQVAVVQGVGYPSPDLSHFTSMANWMSGRPGQIPTSGWLGRHLDAAPAGAVKGVAIGSGVPLHVNGVTHRSVSFPVGSPPPGATTASWDRRMFDSIAATGTSTGRGALADAIGRTCSAMIATAREVAPAYTPPPPTTKLVGDLTLAAQLINIDVGVRVVTVSYGDFDSHANQASMHQDRMEELDAAISAFWSALAPAQAARVTLMTFSEFGRRVQANGSNGTDHGTAGPMLLMGPRVKGGVYGAAPSLTSLDRSGNPIATSDFRQVYAEVLDRWLAGDANEVLGGTFAAHGLFASVPSDPPPSPPPGSTPPPTSPPPSGGAGGFVDVSPQAFYAGPVAWLATEGITTGVGGSDRFAPDAPVTRAEMVTFLWRFAGEPAVGGAIPFSDVRDGLFHSTAVRWAAREGITTGVSGSDRFAPDAHVTRGEMATFLWRYARQPSPGRRAAFVDVDRGAFYAVPVDFMAENGITTGVGGSNRFEPGSRVTRGEMATFLWRFDRAGYRAR
ncbi:DUF1501 domain-containing protein [Actinomarinicola tropica]|uniref:DUF1501 domain-containing protein n=1 Tax=Actinomarinicola tropica TaxID=2789776 RepID=A0A5Q2RHU3_9ACTN|nr:DUF1501 domain-containing protein [Actinomarinicola tropica]QGG96438.1 DUF1501 domain-containing protein [Actinomarinicola tropica]